MKFQRLPMYTTQFLKLSLSPWRVSLVVLLGLFCLNFPPTSSEAHAQDVTASQTLKLGERNILVVHQTIPLKLDGIVDPRTGRSLTPHKLSFVTTDPTVASVDDKDNLVALRASPNPISLLVRLKGTRRQRRTLQAYELLVVESKPNPVAAIKFSPARPAVTPGNATKISALPVDSQGNPVADAKVTWTLDDPDASTYVETVIGANNEIVLFGMPERPDAATTRPTRLLLTAKNGAIVQKGYVSLAKPESNLAHALPASPAPLVSPAPIVAPTPTPPIRLIKTNLEVMDFRTVSYLFGTVTNKQYFAAKLQLFNKLGDLKNGEVSGDSLVVSSDSVKAWVNYEVKYTGGRKDVNSTRREWHPQDVEDRSSPDLRQPLNWDGWKPDPKMVSENGCQQIPRPFSPYTYDQMLNTVDRRDNREWRTYLVTGAQSLSSMAGFITSFAVPGGGSDFPRALEKFNSLLIPSFKEHFPSYKDQQRQNLSSQLMRQTETIPFKQDIVRVVFFPKEFIKTGDFSARISQICRTPIEVEALVARTGDQLPINTISGTVKDSSGKGVEGATITISDNAFMTRTAQTTQSGGYTFPSLLPGSYSLSVTGKGRCARQTTQAVAVTGNQGSIDLTLPAAFKINGSVEDDKHAAVAGATIELQSDDGTKLDSTTTNAKGQYAFDCLQEGDYQLVVTSNKLTFDATPIPVQVKKDVVVPAIKGKAKTVAGDSQPEEEQHAVRKPSTDAVTSTRPARRPQRRAGRN